MVKKWAKGFDKIQIELLEFINMIIEIKNAIEGFNMGRDKFIEGLSNWKAEMMKLNRMNQRETDWK